MYCLLLLLIDDLFAWLAMSQCVQGSHRDKLQVRRFYLLVIHKDSIFANAPHVYFLHAKLNCGCHPFIRLCLCNPSIVKFSPRNYQTHPTMLANITFRCLRQYSSVHATDETPLRPSPLENNAKRPTHAGKLGARRAARLSRKS